MEKKQPEQWAIVELFGHNQIAGLMSECSIGGCSFLRIDVPGATEAPGYTKLFGNGAIYAITITDEETARAAAAHMAPKPMTEWSAREMLKALKPAEDLPSEQERVEDHYVDCCNSDCGWTGLYSETVQMKHGFPSGLCPECHEVTEPKEF